MCDITESKVDILPPELEVIKDIPCYRVILKAILRYQMQQLLTQLSEYTEEESVILSASLSDGTFSHLGTTSGKVFLEEHEELKSGFLNFCLKRNNGQTRSDTRASSPSISPVLSHMGRVSSDKHLPPSGQVSGTNYAYTANTKSGILSPSSPTSSSLTQPQSSSALPTSSSLTQPQFSMTLPTSSLLTQPQSSSALPTSNSQTLLQSSIALPTSKSLTQPQSSRAVQSSSSLTQPQALSSLQLASATMSSSQSSLLFSTPVSSVNQTVFTTLGNQAMNPVVVLHVLPGMSKAGVRVKPYMIPMPRTCSGDSKDSARKKPVCKPRVCSTSRTSFSNNNNETNFRIESVRGAVQDIHETSADLSPSVESQVKMEIAENENANTETAILNNINNSVSLDMSSVDTSTLNLNSANSQTTKESGRGGNQQFAGKKTLDTKEDIDDVTIKEEETEADERDEMAQRNSQNGEEVNIETSTSQLVDMKPSTSQTVAMEPSTSQTVVMESSTSQAVAMEPSTLQTVAMEPSTSPANAVKPSTSQTVAMAPSASQAVTMEPSTSPTVAMATSASQTVAMEPSISQAVTIWPSTSQAVVMKPSSVPTVATLLASLRERQAKQNEFLLVDDHFNHSQEQLITEVDKTSETDDGCFGETNPADDEQDQDSVKEEGGTSDNDDVKALYGSDDGEKLSDLSESEDDGNQFNIQMMKMLPGKKNTKKQNCIYCNKLNTRLTRHLRDVHYKEKEVAKTLRLPKNSKERKQAWADIASRGNFAHNNEVIKTGKGILIPKYRRWDKKRCLFCKRYFTPKILLKHNLACSRKPNRENGCGGETSEGDMDRQGPITKKQSAVRTRNMRKETWKDYLPCQYCWSFYHRYSLARHQKICQVRPQESDAAVELPAIAGGKRLLPRRVSHEEFHNNVLMLMKEDDIRDIVMTDDTILQFGMYLYDEHRHGKVNQKYLSSRMRVLGRLLKLLKQKKIMTLADCMISNNWDVFVDCVKELAEFNPDKDVFGIPHLARMVGIAMKLCAENLHFRALKENDKENVDMSHRFLQIFSIGWEKEVGTKVVASFQYHSENKPSILDLVKDMETLNKCLTEKACILHGSDHTDDVYSDLTRVCLLHVALLNATKMKDVERMTVKQFRCAKKGSLDHSTKDELGKFEQKLCDLHKPVEVAVRQNTKTAILLTEQLRKSIEKLLSMREGLHVESDGYVFGKPGILLGTYRVWDCLRKLAAECKLKHVRSFKSRSCRKHIATIVQVLNFAQESDHEEIVATLQEHGIMIEAPLDIPAGGAALTAKVAKLLVYVDTKEARRFKDSQFGDIALNLNEAIESEEEEEETEGDFLQDQNEDESVTETQPDKRRPKSAKRAKKKKKSGIHNWTSVEKKALEDHFRNNIRKGKVPGKVQCLEVIGEEPCLALFDWKKIKFAVYNMIQKAKSTGEPEHSD